MTPSSNSIMLPMFINAVSNGTSSGNLYNPGSPQSTRIQCDNSIIIHAHIHRSEEHTSELQSRFDLVCRLLLEKKNYINLRLYDNCKTKSYVCTLPTINSFDSSI